MSTTAGRSAHQAAFARRRDRFCRSPEVFRATHRAPCTVSAMSAATAIRMVYQSRMPGSLPGSRSVQSGRKNSPARIERHAPHHVAQRRAEENRQQRAGAGEDGVPERLPHQALDVIAELNGDAAQNQQPEHDHERQIEAAETGSIESGESEIQGAAARQQPHLVAIPHRADGARAPLAARHRCAPPTGARCPRRDRNRPGPRRRRSSPRPARTRWFP